MPFKAFMVAGIGKVTVYKRRGNRYVRLRVAAGGARVSIPYWAPYQAGLDFTLARREWIASQLTTPEPLRTGMPVGKTRRLTLRQDAPLAAPKTKVTAHGVIVTYGAAHDALSGAVQGAARNACLQALRKEADAYLPGYVQELATAHGFTYRSIRCRQLKSRWGSCDQHQNITLSLFLLQLPWELIDYVLLHELTHTQALNHGPDFWHRFEQALPDARARRRRLRAYRPELAFAKPHMA